MKSCFSSTQCESCLTKNIAQSAFQSAMKESVCSNQPARVLFFPPSLPAQSNWFWQMVPTLAGYVFKNSGARICRDNLALVPASLTIATFSSLNNPGPAYWGLRSDHTGKKKSETGQNAHGLDTYEWKTLKCRTIYGARRQRTQLGEGSSALAVCDCSRPRPSGRPFLWSLSHPTSLTAAAGFALWEDSNGDRNGLHSDTV